MAQVLAADAGLQVADRMIYAMGQSIERSKRLDSSFNYEKVFWNSAFAVGLLGLGWVSVQLGKTIQLIQDPVGSITAMADDLGDGAKEAVIDVVENGGDSAWSTLASTSGVFSLVTLYFRNNDEAFQQFKASVEAEETAEAEEESKQRDILDYLDEAYGDYGSIAPAAIVGLNIALELHRVSRARREYRQIEREARLMSTMEANR